ncbi:MAG: hypothetical protein HY690_06185 [Chloroflexi bacterium]|nr:hypothetical protein [Chloroflexota bacterium]
MTVEEDDRFAAALEECCRRVQRGEPLERCLADYPAAYQQELARLVPLAGRVGQLARDPSPEFQARLERRLLASVDEARRGRRVGLLSRLGRLFAGPAMRTATVALVVMAVLVGGGVEVEQAAADSLPDSPLYRVKEAREWVTLTLARDGETRVGVHAAQIAQRGRELERAVQTGKPRRVVDVLALRLAWSIDQIVDQALELQAQGNPRPARRALVALRAMERPLDRLTAQASPEARPALERLHTFLDEQERRLTVVVV